MNMTTTLDANVNNELARAESYKKVLPAMQALRPEEVMGVNVDLASTVPTMLGALPQIAAYRTAVAEAFTNYPVSNFDNLENWTLALAHANALFMIASDSPDNLPALAEEGAALLVTLKADCDSLIVRKLMNPDALKDYSGQKGYKTLAINLQIVGSALTEAWPRIQGKCGTEQTELDRADKLATRIQRLVGLREQSPAEIAESADNRARAFTVFYRGYNQVRRAISFLRWDEDDVEKIAPSLYAGRKHKASSENVVPVVAPAPAPAPAAANVATPPAPCAPINTLKAPVPGSNPFMQ
jgi:hypothetical protein